MSLCDYCNHNKTIPKDHFKTIFKEIKEQKNKKLLDSFIILNFSPKAIKKLKIYIPYYSNEFVLYIRNKVNYKYYDIGIINCNLCKRKACPTHFLWSNFYNGKCLNCNKLISICGWCNSKICKNCINSN
jgi:hypothetical protein